MDRTKRSKVAQSPVGVALKRLGQRPYTSREISDYLTRKQYLPEDVQATISRLTELGYLNDFEAAQATIRYRLRHPRGRRLVAQELRHRGLDQETVDAALSAYDESALAEQLASRLAAQGKSKEAVQRALASRGFASSSVFAATADLAADGDLS